jgi:RNA polymerase sigma-70 factor (ECF subfamily)
LKEVHAVSTAIEQIFSEAYRQTEQQIPYTGDSSGDEAIIRMFTARQEQALTETESRYGKWSRRLAFRILGDRQDAEECANDVLMQLWDSIPPVIPQSLPAYISTLTRHTALNRFEERKAAKRGGGQMASALDEIAPFLADPEQDMEDSFTEIALRDALTAFLGTLPAENRLIFLARFWSFQPVAEIAAEHGMSVGAVKMSLKRTKDKLRKYLKKEGLI